MTRQDKTFPFPDTRIDKRSRIPRPRSYPMCLEGVGAQGKWVDSPNCRLRFRRPNVGSFCHTTPKLSPPPPLNHGDEEDFHRGTGTPLS